MHSRTSKLETVVVPCEPEEVEALVENLACEVSVLDTLLPGMEGNSPLLIVDEIAEKTWKASEERSCPPCKLSLEKVERRARGTYCSLSPKVAFHGEGGTKYKGSASRLTYVVSPVVYSTLPSDWGKASALLLAMEEEKE